MKCDGPKFNDAALFLTDYLECLSGNISLCQAVSDYATSGKAFTGASYLKGTLYVSSRILSMAQTTLLDAKRNAKDSSYKNVLMEQMGGKNIDKIVKKYDGNMQSALEDIDSKLSLLDPNNKRKRKDPPFTLDEIPKTNRERFKELLEVESKISTRLSNHRENLSLMNRLNKKTSNIMESSLSNLKHLDGELTRLDDQLKSTRIDSDKQELMRKINFYEALKKTQLESLPITETQVQEIAEAHNQIIDSAIKKIENLNRERSSISDQRYSETIKALKEKKIKIPRQKMGTYSRLILDTSKTGYSLVDINGKWGSLPDWAQDLRLSQFREMPFLVRKVIQDNPNLATNIPLLEEKVADLEHERYRDYNQKRLIRLYNKDQIFQQTPQLVHQQINKNSFIESGNLDLKNKVLTINQNTIVIDPEVKAAFAQYKKNWLEVDVPYHQLSESNKRRTVAPVQNFIDERFPGVRNRAYMKNYEQYILKKPILSKLAGHATSMGLGWGAGLGMAWYDMYDYADLAINLTFPYFDSVKEFFWDKVAPSCRMPDIVELGTKDPIKKPAKFLCECQTDETPLSNLPTSCRAIPTLMSAVTKKYCELARRSGRDRDLFIAKAYSHLEDHQSELKSILKASVGCNVMKNQPSNCRLTTNDITLQGMYYLTLIQSNDLFKPISELCPDICEHWVNIAKEKAKEIADFKNKRRLPETPKANKAEDLNCSSFSSNDNPPLNKKLNLKWRQCQKPIVCLPNQKIRVNVSSRQRYEIELDQYTLHPRRVFYHLFSDFGASQEKAANGLENPISPLVYDKKVFMYAFDEEGLMNSLVTYKFNSSNDIDESYSKDELVSNFGNEAFNTKSNAIGAPIEKLPLAKRFELMDLIPQAQNYCCKYEFDCDKNLKLNNPMDELNLINNAER